MCGIGGLFNPASTPDQETLARMNDCLVHRGPDESGIYRDGPIGLAHRRLSIVDVDGGRQPIRNEDGSVVVIFNGEIYNYQSLRNGLVSKGHTFTSETDTEVLVHLYEEEGLSFVDRLEGMFAFALWDCDAERLLLARDPVGIKPLVVADDGDTVGFASEVRSLLATDIDHGGLDRAALELYFSFGHVPAPYAAFDNISKLRPGELAIVDEDSIRRRRYYTPSPAESAPDFDTATTRLRSTVFDAVEKRLQGDVPLGAFLSGGIDSSIVVGAMAELTDQPVDTFTVGFDRALFDESRAARDVADYHDTNHHEFVVSPADVRELIPEVLSRMGEPFADQSLLPSYVVARETSREVKVALSGDGADELFAGYDKYRVEDLSRYYRALPRRVRETVVEPAVNALPASRGSKVGTRFYQGQWFVNRSGQADPVERHFELMRVPDIDAMEKFDAVDGTVGRSELRQRHKAVADWLPHEDDLARIQAVDARYSLPNQMLHKVDRASMYNSLEARVPFLDTDVVEFAMSLPTRYKITRSDRKRVLKEAFTDLLPESILARDKHGFDMPVGAWLAEDLAEDFRTTVRSVDLGVVDDDAVFRAFADHRADERELGKFLWSVYVFKHWGRRMRDEGVL